MASQQSWPLSQDANKASGTCSHCYAVRQLHLKDGTVHAHGPRNSPCPGSHKPPLPSSASASAPLSASQPLTNLETRPTMHTPASLVASPSSTARPANPLTMLHSQVIPQSQKLTDALPSTSTSTTFSHPSINAPIIKHIPKTARPACCTALSGLLNSISHSSDGISNWSNLLGFGQANLQKPSRGGKKHNLANIIKKRLCDKPQGAPGHTTGFCDYDAPPRRRLDSASALSAAVTAKIEDGNVKAALRILCSEDKQAPDNSETLSKLTDIHPVSSPIGPIPSTTSKAGNTFQASESDVLKAIRSFPAGSSGGPDGIRPQHIVDLVNCREQGPALLSAITSFINCLLDGKCPPTVRPVLFGGNLIALTKKTGGIRPIAIGYTWRRIAAKCANAFASARLATLLSPRQLGIAVKGGCEAAVHATRQVSQTLPADHAIVKLDFSNAFNCLGRGPMLNAISNHVPEILKFCLLSYGNPSFLRFHDQCILSQEGVQQGDPLGPLLFSLTIHPILTSASSALVIGYLDDITLGGDMKTLASDVLNIQTQAKSMGLTLNVKKCEFISHSNGSSEAIFKDFIHIDPKNATLLGAPLNTGPSMDDALSSRCIDLEIACNRLKVLAAHDALVLLRASFSAPKLMHIMRSSPCAGHPSLNRFDSLLREGLSQITNSHLSDTQWIQASLPVKEGGLGIRRVASLAPSAFLASAASTLDLQKLILAGSSTAPDAAVESVGALWSSTHNLPCPPPSTASLQQSWDRPQIDTDLAAVQSSAIDDHNRARVLAVASPHAGDWLYALPITNCGLRLDDETIRVAVGLRLGLNLCQPHPCPCGKEVDSRGTHGLACKLSAGRMSRHHHINDLVWRALHRAGIPSSKEPSGLSKTEELRPDGVTLIPWQGGKNLMWDVTVADTLAASHLSTTARLAGGAAESASDRKEAKYSSFSRSYTFIPISCETMGPLSSKAASFFTDLGRRISAVSGDPRESAFLFQRISVAIQRFNCVCFKGSFISPPDSEW